MRRAALAALAIATGLVIAGAKVATGAARRGDDYSLTSGSFALAFAALFLVGGALVVWRPRVAAGAFALGAVAGLGIAVVVVSGLGGLALLWVLPVSLLAAALAVTLQVGERE